MTAVWLRTQYETRAERAVKEQQTEATSAMAKALRDGLVTDL